MDATRESDRASGKQPTTVERRSECEFVVTRTFNCPARLVFEAWTTPELIKQWWVPKSMNMQMLVCETDVRVGGKYRYVFSYEGSTMEFFGRYTEVTSPSRLAWTNEEGEGDAAITTVTFEEKGGQTLVVLSEVHPSKEACDAAMGFGEGLRETFGQLDDLLASLTVQR